MALLHELMQADTAGDPQSDQKWSRKDTPSISQEMTARGVPLCPNTAAKLLKHQKYSLRVNRKSMGETQHPDRNRQFELIAYFRKRFEDAGSPILSLDTKKKELIGNFRNAGRAWRKDPELVNQHDFRSQASALVSPYGLYEPVRNHGTDRHRHLRRHPGIRRRLPGPMDLGSRLGDLPPHERNPSPLRQRRQ